MYEQTNKQMKIEKPGVSQPLLGPAKNALLCKICFLKENILIFSNVG